MDRCQHKKSHHTTGPHWQTEDEATTATHHATTAEKALAERGQDMEARMPQSGAPLLPQRFSYLLPFQLNAFTKEVKRSGSKRTDTHIGSLDLVELQ